VKNFAIAFCMAFVRWCTIKKTSFYWNTAVKIIADIRFLFVCKWICLPFITQYQYWIMYKAQKQFYLIIYCQKVSFTFCLSDYIVPICACLAKFNVHSELVMDVRFVCTWFDNRHEHDLSILMTCHQWLIDKPVFWQIFCSYIFGYNYRACRGVYTYCYMCGHHLLV